MLFLRIAYRNLRRHRRRTQLTMSAMILANALLIFSLSMNDGLIWDIINSSTEVIPGHLTLAAPGYLERPTLHAAIPEDPAFRESLRRRPGVRGVCGRVSCFALLSCGKDTACRTLPAEILGIDPREELSVSRLPRSVAEGIFLPDPSTRGILLGKGLARNLEAKVGSEIVLMGQAADGSMAAEVFQLFGIFDTGDTLRDSALALVGRKTAQELFCLDGKIHTWRVFLRQPLAAEEAAATWVPAGGPIEATSWQKLLPQMAAILKFLGIIQVIIMVIFYSAVFLVSSNTMYMAFLERTREFAIIRAIGLSPRRLARLLLLEGMLLSGVSAVLGTGLGYAIAVSLSWWPIDLSPFFSTLSYCGSSLQPRLICQPTWTSVLMPFFALLFLGPFAALFPIIRLRGLRPVEAMREG